MNNTHFEGLTAATTANIVRKSRIVDVVTRKNGYPIPTWIDLNVTELCNRRCVFCPRVNDDLYPNQPLHISDATIQSFVKGLDEIGFRGVVVLSGYGEPLLHPDLPGVVRQLASSKWRVELVTNGDKLSVDSARRLFDAGLNYFVVSLYDGPEQIEHFNGIFAAAGVGVDGYTLRDRWYDESQNFGLKLTSRVGNVEVTKGITKTLDNPCFYTSYSMSLDWNGDVLLCVQDWDKRVKFGNVNDQSLFTIWTSPAIMKRRMALIRGDRCQSPCLKCDTNGKVHGSLHAQAWTATDTAS